MRSETDARSTGSHRSAISRLLLLLLVVPTALLFGCTGDAPNLQGVADQFSAPDTWRPMGQNEVSETLCVGPSCDTIVVAWAAREAPTGAEIGALMQAAGWAGAETNDCQVRADVTGPVPFCRGTAEVAGADVELTASGPIVGVDEPYLITLHVSS
ncbi:MAG: hypothetical protein HKN44_15415 [Ilumatobacter sp.]|nr:hypothetical protein [Ilumatobacter sp.]